MSPLALAAANLANPNLLALARLASATVLMLILSKLVRIEVTSQVKDGEIDPNLAPKGFRAVKDTIKGFNMIMDGELDHIPESAFNLKGTIEEAIEAGEKMLAEA